MSFRWMMVTLVLVGCAGGARPVDRARALAWEQAVTRDERVPVDCAARELDGATWRAARRRGGGWSFVVTHPDRPGWRLVVEVASDRGWAAVREEASGTRRRRRWCSRTAPAFRRWRSG